MNANDKRVDWRKLQNETLGWQKLQAELDRMRHDLDAKLKKRVTHLQEVGLLGEVEAIDYSTEGDLTEFRLTATIRLRDGWRDRESQRDGNTSPQ